MSKKIILWKYKIYTTTPWIDFFAQNYKDIEAWEKTYDHKITIKSEPYVMVKRNIALLPLPQSMDEFKKGKKMQAFRTNYNKALKKRYSTGWFDASQYYDDIMEINCSSVSRCGRVMDEFYTDCDAVKSFIESKPQMWGCFDYNGKLVAYIEFLSGGKLVTINQILGHSQFLADGIMYYLLGNLIQFVIDSGELITHFMYGSFYTGENSAGVFYYKQRMGFIAYNVRYNIPSRGCIDSCNDNLLAE